MDRVSVSELAVLRALWTREPVTAAELAEMLERERGWSLSTVKTLLARLVEKHVIVTEKDGRRFLYRAAIAREDYAADQSRRLIDDLFDGRAAPLVAHLARRNALTPEDVAEIAALLKAIEE